MFYKVLSKYNRGNQVNMKYKKRSEEKCAKSIKFLRLSIRIPIYNNITSHVLCRKRMLKAVAFSIHRADTKTDPKLSQRAISTNARLFSISS